MEEVPPERFAARTSNDRAKRREPARGLHVAGGSPVGPSHPPTPRSNLRLLPTRSDPPRERTSP